MIRPSLKSAIVVLLLFVGMATQSLTAGFAMVAGGGVPGAAASLTVAGDADGFLADVLLSVCSQDKGKRAKTGASADHCLYCPPLAHRLEADAASAAVPLPRTAILDEPWPGPQVPPPSRRMAGDGPSRAPPSIA
ncbi:hypothetical protein [Magnetospirillum sp. SS-4]|uniref:hypothetical protein n=1 Tax=Magnetospirillum sp. SS-4 TaxID=2681465 RepID=UPI001571E3AF|nr:hypothetical protein [Magnetospirillum sp. SS-4]